MRKIIFISSIVLLFLILSPCALLAHCEIPCGIYDDQMRIKMIEEDITTIEKSMDQIEKLSKKKNKNMNQIVRWIINKENHCDYLGDIVTQYFMAQRINPVDASDSDEYKKYIENITLLHKMLYHATKAKQSTDQRYVKALRTLLKSFEKAYFAGETK